MTLDKKDYPAARSLWDLNWLLQVVNRRGLIAACGMALPLLSHAQYAAMSFEEKKRKEIMFHVLVPIVLRVIDGKIARRQEDVVCLPR